MTQSQTIDVTCQACGHVSPHDYQGVVEAATQPEMVDKLLEGTLFDHVCPQCGAVFGVAAPVLFRDDDRRLMINLAPDLADTAEVEQLFETAGLGDSDLSYKDAGFTLRIVGDPNSLREKVLAFQCGLDDRVLEVLKLTVAMAAAEQGGTPPQGVLFEGADQDSLSFCLVGPSPQTVAVARASYDALAGDLQAAGITTQDANATYYVTPLWALEQYRLLTQRAGR